MTCPGARCYCGLPTTVPTKELLPPMPILPGPAKVMAPAIRLAGEGFPVYPLAHVPAKKRALLQLRDLTMEAFPTGNLIVGVDGVIRRKP